MTKGYKKDRVAKELKLAKLDVRALRDLSEQDLMRVVGGAPKVNW